MLTGWKTIIIGVLVSVFGFLETFDFTSILNAETAPIVTTVIGGVMVVLRFLTNTPALKP